MMKAILVAIIALVLIILISGCPKPPTDGCGDGVCDKFEEANPTVCPQDCEPLQPACGNGICEQGETELNCPQDCKEAPCTENWDCSNWLNCVDGQQARTCTDSNNCGTTSSKPSESRACEELSIAEKSPFGFQPAIVVPPNEYGISNPYDFALDLGAKWDRSLIFPWTAIQLSLAKKEYSWFNDNQIKSAPGNINLVANILIGSPLESDSDKYYQYAQKGSFLPQDKQAYLQFIKAVVERYDGDGIDDMPGLNMPIKYWQVDNEVPMGKKDYAEFLKITYLAIKEADPEAKILMGSVPGMPPVSTYLESFDRSYLPILDKLAAFDKKYFDILDIHWYGNATGDYLGIKEVYNHIKQKVDKRNLSPTDGYWITEMGTYSGKPKPVFMGGKMLLEGYPYQSEKQQAQDLIKRNVYSISLGIKKIFMEFSLKEGFKYDEGYFDFTGLIYDGVYDHDLGKGVKKLGYYTYKLMAEKLGGSDWDNIQTIKEEQNDAYGIFLYNFTNNGKNIYVGWQECFDEQQCNILKVNTGIELDFDGAKQVKITEAVPKYDSGKEVTNYSTAFSTETKTVSNGKVTITLGKVPVFIEVEE